MLANRLRLVALGSRTVCFRRPEQQQLGQREIARCFSAVTRTTPMEKSEKGYMERQRELGRPVSPHVTIYDFPIAALSSVGHRITGGMLTIGKLELLLQFSRMGTY